MTVRIGNAAGFLGDNIDAPRLLAETGQLDYLTLEYLAELTLSILARSREKDPQKGYAIDFLEVLRSLTGILQSQTKLKIVTNAGGMNPISCARASAKILCDTSLSHGDLNNLAIGVVTGDDLLPQIDQLMAEGIAFENLDTDQPLCELNEKMVSANAYLGARPIAEALQAAARIVITGRVADASLTVAPAMVEFEGDWGNWDWQNWNQLAAASVAGHLIECGAQVTGGYSTCWEDYDLAEVGYPIAELQSDGNLVITKPANTSGRVDRETVVEQLVYEIGDPQKYITPDVVVDFTSVEVQDLGNHRVLVTGATGQPAPDSYKVSLAFHDGYTASGTLLVVGRDAIKKAKACAAMILSKVHRAGFKLAATNIECLGAGDGLPGVNLFQAHNSDDNQDQPFREVLLRVTASDPRKQAITRFCQEIAPLITSGPAGLAGYAAGRAIVRPRFAYWPTLIPKNLVQPQIEVRTASDWLK